MAIKITDECINCGACEPECPNNAIYEGALEWRFSEGTDLSGKIITPNGNKYDADEAQEPVDYDVYYIVTDKCTECIGFHEEPQVLHYDNGKTNLSPILEPGMTFTIEPMINLGDYQVITSRLDGWTVTTKDRSLSAQWEHTILVTETGHEILTLRAEENI